MPLSRAGERFLMKMKRNYGDKKGREIFYASINKGKPGSNKWHRKNRQRARVKALRS